GAGVDGRIWIRLDIPREHAELRLACARTHIDLTDGDHRNTEHAVRRAELTGIVVRRIARDAHVRRADAGAPMPTGPNLHWPHLDASAKTVSLGDLRQVVALVALVVRLNAAVSVEMELGVRTQSFVDRELEFAAREFGALVRRAGELRRVESSNVELD